MDPDNAGAPGGTGARPVLLIAPAPPPYGGMALQAQLLENLLRRDGIPVSFVRSNVSFPAALRAVEGVPGLRTALRFGLLCVNLVREVRRAEVVHIFAASWVYFFAVVYPAVIVARLFGRRVVVNYRGGEADRFFRFYGWLARPVFTIADIVTTPSRFLAEVLAKHFGISAAIVPNILDTRVFRRRQRTTFRPRIVTARHLEKIYDIESVLKAFRVVQESYPDATLTLAGTGSQEAHLRTLVSMWNLKYVQFAGCVNHDDLPALYDDCDIFLNASRVDNFPGALLEASAAGLAMAPTAAGGIPWIYEDGKTAFLAAPGDWRGLAQAVLKVLECPDAARLTTEAAAELVKAFEWSKVRQLLFQAYGFADQLPQAALLVDERESETKCIAG
jgi:glycosyltransferase involved in cell wall biosynthesis